MRQQLIIVLFTLIAAEAVLRLVGFEPHRRNDYRIESSPSFCLVPHARLGYALQPGDFQVQINEGLSYSALHLYDSTRFTGWPAASADTARSNPSRRVHTYGCSFTYGLGVDDSLTWPYRLQGDWPGTTVHNYAVPGHGTVQSWMQLRQHLRGGKIPDLVIVAYSALMHDPRNRLTRSQRQQWSEAFSTPEGEARTLFAQANFPYVRSADSLQIEFQSMDRLYRPWPGSRQSALIHLAETAWNSMNDSPRKAHSLSRRIILDMDRLLRSRQSRLVVAGITNDPQTGEALDFFRDRDILCTDISLDISDPQFNLMPHDGHPNAVAHAHYAREITRFMVEQDLTGR